MIVIVATHFSNGEREFGCIKLLAANFVFIRKVNNIYLQYYIIHEATPNPFFIYW